MTYQSLAKLRFLVYLGLQDNVESKVDSNIMYLTLFLFHQQTSRLYRIEVAIPANRKVSYNTNVKICLKKIVLKRKLKVCFIYQHDLPSLIVIRQKLHYLFLTVNDESFPFFCSKMNASTKSRILSSSNVVSCSFRIVSNQSKKLLF